MSMFGPPAPPNGFEKAVLIFALCAVPLALIGLGVIIGIGIAP
jgi:hypothetical protein